jgi:hypothetical protein
MHVVPGQMLQFPFSHSSEQHRGEYSLLFNIAGGKEPSQVFRRHEFGQSLFRQSKTFNHRGRIRKEVVLFDCPVKERVNTLQLVINGFLRNFLIQLIAPQPAILRVGLWASTLWVALQLLSKLRIPSGVLLNVETNNLSGKPFSLVILDVSGFDVFQKDDSRMKLLEKRTLSPQHSLVAASRTGPSINIEML